MLKKIVGKYYYEENYSCSEALLLGINEFYKLNLREKDFEFVTAFGGGFGCERICGALTGCLAIFGKLFYVDKETMHKLSEEIILDFEKNLKTSDCSELKKIYRNEKFRCLKTVELAADIFEKFIEKNVKYMKE